MLSSLTSVPLNISYVRNKNHITELRTVFISLKAVQTGVFSLQSYVRNRTGTEGSTVYGRLASAANGLSPTHHSLLSLLHRHPTLSQRAKLKRSHKYSLALAPLSVVTTLSTREETYDSNYRRGFFTARSFTITLQAGVTSGERRW